MQFQRFANGSGALGANMKLMTPLRGKIRPKIGGSKTTNMKGCMPPGVARAKLAGKLWEPVFSCRFLVTILEPLPGIARV